MISRFRAIDFRVLARLACSLLGLSLAMTASFAAVAWAIENIPSLDLSSIDRSALFGACAMLAVILLVIARVLR